MKALILGSGGREHALLYSLKKSRVITEAIAAPGNGGISEMCPLFPLNILDAKEVTDLARSQKIDLVVIGPEAPLVAGVADALRHQGILVYGPGKEGAKLEGSKAFAKNFMKRQNIPTAPFDVCSDLDEAKKALVKRTPPYVIKADGLAAGKGAFVVSEMKEAEKIASELLVERRLGEAGQTIVVEDFLKGYELTAMAVTDGKTYRMLPLSQDHKRAFDGDEGPNTGGMGAYSPLPQVSKLLINRIEREIIAPTVEGLKAEGRDFIGTIYAGIMVHDGDPYVLEYNVRFGDPEAQVVLPICDVDWGDLFTACCSGTLDEFGEIKAKTTAVGVVMASGGYPDSYEMGYPIEGLERLKDREDVLVFHSGTKKAEGKFFTDGGRILTIVGLADDLRQAREKAYHAVSSITFRNAHYRRDIAWQAFV